MARKTGEMPKVSIHSSSQNARVRIGGKTHWLGRCPAGKVTREQLAKAARLWQLHLAGELAGEPVPPPAVAAAPAATPAPASTPAVAEPEAGGITLAALGVRYLDWAEGYYRTADGGTTSSVDGIRMALKALFPFSDLPAATFGPECQKLLMPFLLRHSHIVTVGSWAAGLVDWAVVYEPLPWRVARTAVRHYNLIRKLAAADVEGGISRLSS